MKKETLMLAVVIAALSIYLATLQKDKTNYELPEVDEIKTEQITTIDITKGKQTISVKRNGDDWILTDKGYPAEKAKIENILDSVKKITLTALVSEKEDLIRYGLDPDEAIKVIGKNKSKTLRSMSLGKTASTYNHTFVRLKGDPNVYQAKGDIRTHFEKTVLQLRDKKVLSLKTEAVEKIQLIKNGIKKSFVSKPTTPLQKGKKNEKPEISVSKAPEKKWENETGKETDRKSIENLIDTIKTLECAEYAEGDDKEFFRDKQVLCKISIQEKDELIIYEAEGETYPAISSGNNYPFYLSKFDGDNLLESVDKILGIEKKEEATGEKGK